MQISHPFDIAMAIRGRRKQLKLRQAEVAQAANVGREWLVEIEHGKPTAEIGKVLRTFEALGIDIDITMAAPAPAWTLPLTAAAEDHRARILAARAPAPQPRADITPPPDYPRKDLWERRKG